MQFYDSINEASSIVQSYPIINLLSMARLFLLILTSSLLSTAFPFLGGGLFGSGNGQLPIPSTVLPFLPYSR